MRFSRASARPAWAWVTLGSGAHSQPAAPTPPTCCDADSAVLTISASSVTRRHLKVVDVRHAAPICGVPFAKAQVGRPTRHSAKARRAPQLRVARACAEVVEVGEDPLGGLAQDGCHQHRTANCALRQPAALANVEAAAAQFRVVSRRPDDPLEQVRVSRPSPAVGDVAPLLEQNFGARAARLGYVDEDEWRVVPRHAGWDAAAEQVWNDGGGCRAVEFGPVHGWSVTTAALRAPREAARGRWEGSFACVNVNTACRRSRSRACDRSFASSCPQLVSANLRPCTRQQPPAASHRGNGHPPHHQNPGADRTRSSRSRAGRRAAARPPLRTITRARLRRRRWRAARAAGGAS